MKTQIGVSTTMASCKKRRSTYYPPQKVAAARENIQKYGWARQMRDEAAARADLYLGKGLDFLWRSVPSYTLPRSYGVNQALGSPVTGHAIDSYGNYPYQADPLNDPWKIVDPSCGLRFPTNDFEAYYNSGLDEHGIFRKERADRTLLVNTLYPEKGPTWGVDDGFGWVDEHGNCYTFIAYYVHWFLWYRTGLIDQALQACRDAYLYTGEVSYARAGIALLDRVADMYPQLDISVFDQGIFLNSHGLTMLGKTIGSIWETELVKTFLSAYDAFYPAMDDPETVRFLSGGAAQYGHANPKTSGDAIRRNVEEGIVEQIYPAVKAAKIRGNDGMHQSALALAAVVYDTMPDTEEWLDFVFQSGTASQEGVTGGNILAALVDEINRDGSGTEVAVLYNMLWLNGHRMTADILRHYDRYPHVKMYEHPKFKKMFTAFFPLIMLNRYTANMGDQGPTGMPGIFLKIDDAIRAFDEWGDPIFAQWSYFLNGNQADGIRQDIFTPDPEGIADRIRKVIAEHGPLQRSSVNLSGYGFAALRDGQGEAQRDVWMYYGRNRGHGHADNLNLGIYAFGLDLAPDLGYPEFADARDMHRAQWVINTISHNTVVVDRRKQEEQWVAQPMHYDDSDGVKLIDAQAPQVYPHTELYRRTTAMIKVDDDNSYVVDFFRVRGGDEHLFSFHSAEGTVTTEGLRLVPQQDDSGSYIGSYAGADIPFGQRADDVEGFGYQGSGFHWLKHVDRDPRPAPRFSVDWAVKDTWNVYGAGAHAPTPARLRLTMLGEADEAALADGVPPRNKPGNPDRLRYLLVSRRGTNLDSVFTSVLEPYQHKRFIASVESARVTKDGVEVTGARVRAVKVTLDNGRIDTIICALDADTMYVVDEKLTFQGFFGVYSETSGAAALRYVHDGAWIGLKEEPARKQAGAVSGTIIDFTRGLTSRNQLTVTMDGGEIDVERLVGSFLYGESRRGRNAVYKIEGIKQSAERTYELDIGSTTTIHSYEDADDLERGFIYDVAVGDTFRIPLTNLR